MRGRGRVRRRPSSWRVLSWGNEARTDCNRIRAARGPSSAAVELGRLAAEERLDAAAQVLRRHAVGDPVPLELEVLGEVVLDALATEQLRHPHVVGCLRGELLG